MFSLFAWSQSQEFYFFEREPESVRAELGRGARPGLASFQVLTRTLWVSKSAICFLEQFSEEAVRKRMYVSPRSRIGRDLPLRPIRILLRTHFLHTDFQPAVFGESHVLLLHVLLAAVCELIAPQVDLVAEVGAAADDCEQNDEREE